MATTAEKDVPTDGETPETTGPSAAKPATAQRTVRVPVSTVLVAAAGALLLTAAVTFGTLWAFARGDLADRDTAAAEQRQAEQVAIDYATGASTIDYQDFNAWIGRLKANTTADLATKFDTTAPKMRDLVTPLRWTSTATPDAAKVMSDNAGVYVVNVYLTVSSTSVQTPGGGMTTVAYKVTVNKSAGWKITDVGTDHPVKATTK
ncbi:hypothetical protein [Nocardia pseudovaccinii]|uniref:hypothetical protein n=1 Tax=Nocardia pseudovaccinii TaxID=189540 RepID=UPI000AEEEAD4|nr:hypothetical protein [Nocardia pseudovaccinii]